jgi:hypothetical protein
MHSLNLYIEATPQLHIGISKKEAMHVTLQANIWLVLLQILEMPILFAITIEQSLVQTGTNAEINRQES